MLTILLTALQAAQPATAERAGPADIQLQVRAQVREVRVRQQGEASLTVRGGPGSEVRVEAPSGGGTRRLRNVNVIVDAEARVAEGGDAGLAAEVEASAEPHEMPAEAPARDEDATVSPE